MYFGWIRSTFLRERMMKNVKNNIILKFEFNSRNFMVKIGPKFEKINYHISATSLFG